MISINLGIASWIDILSICVENLLNKRRITNVRIVDGKILKNLVYEALSKGVIHRGEFNLEKKESLVTLRIF